MRHIITGEYPPSVGGVAAYTAIVAEALAATGEAVHVWCPGSEGTVRTAAGVFVHRQLGTLSRLDLARAERVLAMMAGPRRVLVQWVPHAYGHGSVNVGFCRWVRRLALRGDSVDVMVHEPFLTFTGGLRRRSAAAIHRWMLYTILSRASHAYVPTCRWEALCRPYARHLEFTWMPVPSGIRRHASADTAADCRAALSLPAHDQIVGVFGTALRPDVLTELAVALERNGPPATLLLVGAGSAEHCDAIQRASPAAGRLVRATGVLKEEDVSRLLRACDLCVQPYFDGVSGRRSSAMAILAHGAPLLATNGVATEGPWKCIPEMVHDAAALPAAMLRMLRDPAAAARLARDGRELYSARFEVRHTVKLLQSLH